MKKLLLAGIAFAAVAGPATAADLARRPVYKARQLIPYVYNWTGFYIGAHIGYGWDSEDPSAVGIEHQHLNPIPSYNANRGLAGLQAGVNYQIKSWVVGGEGEFAWTSISGGATWFPPGADFEPHTISSDVKRLATAAGRVGYAFDRALIYAKGGAAWENVDYGHSHTHASGFVHLFSGSAARSGWLIGGGIEYAFWQNVSAKIEFDHIDFGSKDITTSDAAGDFVIFNIGQRLNIVKTGINYKF
jgi:outer membrane immunogenic protein